MSIAALRELRRLFPDAHIALHTRSWAEGIFRDASFIDEIIPFDEGRSNFRTMLAEARSLRKRKFDLAILLPNSFRSAAMVKLAGIPNRIGYATDGRSMLLTKAVKVPEWKSSRHEAYYYLELIAEAAGHVSVATETNAEPSIFLEISDDRKQKARKILHEIGLDTGRPIIAMGPGSTNSLAKRWPAQNFAILNNKLRSDLNAGVVLLGSGNESDVGQAVIESAGSRPASLIGKTSLDDASAILSVVDLFVSNDMGLAHLAAAVGTKTAVIFGPTDPVTTRPFADHAMVIREPVDCSPCMLRDCPIDHRCMTRISPERVFTVIADLLK